MEKHVNKHLVLKVLLALLPTLVFVQNYAWMTANKMVGIAFLVLWAFIIFTAWSFTEKHRVFERYFRLMEVGLFLLPLSGLIMTFVLGSQAIGSTSDEFSQAGAAIGTAIGGTFVVVIAFIIGIPVGIIMHLVANSYGKKADASGVKQPETFATKHGVIASVGLLILLAIVLGAIAGSNETPTSQEQEAISQEDAVPEETIEILATDLYAAYSANQLGADSQYKGKLLQVTGVVENIGSDFLDNPYLTLKTNDLIGSVQCRLNDAGVQAATQISKGMTIAVIGRGTGYSVATVGLDDCEIVSD